MNEHDVFEETLDRLGCREPYVLMWVTHDHSHVQDQIM
jgi:hypothetical protein